MITSEYVAEIAAMRRDTSNKAEGHLLENYVHNNRMHDYFDTGKMYFALEEFAIKTLVKKSWRVGKAEILNIKPKKETDPNQPKEKNTTQPETKSSWMNGH